MCVWPTEYIDRLVVYLVAMLKYLYTWSTHDTNTGTIPKTGKQLGCAVLENLNFMWKSDENFMLNLPQATVLICKIFMSK